MDRVVFKNFGIWFLLTIELICCNDGTHCFFFVDGTLFLHTMSQGCFFDVARYQAFQIETATIDDT